MPGALRMRASGRARGRPRPAQRACSASSCTCGSGCSSLDRKQRTTSRSSLQHRAARGVRVSHLVRHAAAQRPKRVADALWHAAPGALAQAMRRAAVRRGCGAHSGEASLTASTSSFSASRSGTFSVSSVTASTSARPWPSRRQTEQLKENIRTRASRRHAARAAASPAARAAQGAATPGGWAAPGGCSRTNRPRPAPGGRRGNLALSKKLPIPVLSGRASCAHEAHTALACNNGTQDNASGTRKPQRHAKR